jgi:hypothetical protein
MHIVKAKIDAGMEVEVLCAKGIEIFGPDREGNASLLIKRASSAEQAAEKSGMFLNCFFLNRAKIVSCREIS